MGNRSWGLSRRGQLADHLERAYIVSERQAAAAEVQGQKDEMTSQNDRWRAEAAGRSAEAHREASTLGNVVRRGGAKDVADAYLGREPEHRQERAAVLEEIEALKRANDELKSMRAQLVSKVTQTRRLLLAWPCPQADTTTQNKLERL